MRLTYAQIKDEVGRPIGTPSTDPQLIQLVNEACETLWNSCDWVGKYIVYRLRVTSDCEGNACIIWPRNLETIEGINVCSQPVGMRNQWFDFLENGPGELEYYHAGKLLGDRGEVCTLEEIRDVRSKVKVYADKVEATDAKILILGYDENRNWIRTQVDGEWVDGEYVAINYAAPTISTNYFSKITGIQKPLTNGYVRLHSMNVDTLTETLIGVYEYDEKTPVYRRSILTGGTCADCECVTVKGKRRFIPAVVDTDYIYPSLLPALQVMLIGIRKRDNMNFNDYGVAVMEARRLLTEQAKAFNGSGAFRPVRFINGKTWAPSRNVQ